MPLTPMSSTEIDPKPSFGPTTIGPATHVVNSGPPYPAITVGDILRQEEMRRHRMDNKIPLNFDGSAKQDVVNKLPTDPEARKKLPIATGVLDYFPLALAYVASVSKAGNDQHNPGQPMHWAREKSTDHANTIVRHLAERGTKDVDGKRHTGKLAWRALALLQTELEAAIANGEDPFE